jgi:GNAT superfamily N-acetyltransferase
VAAVVLGSSLEVRRAARDEVPQLAATLASAFSDDPLWGPYFFPDVERRRERLVRFFTAELESVALPHGEVWTTGGEIRGVAIWAPPGFWRVPLRTALVRLPTMVSIFGGSLRRVFRALRAIERRHPREPAHYYLAFLGVTPPHQGRGIGTGLMRPVLERCDREALPAYLEASTVRSARCYERVGFEVVEEAVVPAGPPFRLMWRTPGSGSDPVASRRAREPRP